MTTLWSRRERSKYGTRVRCKLLLVAVMGLGQWHKYTEATNTTAGSEKTLVELKERWQQ